MFVDKGLKLKSDSTYIFNLAFLCFMIKKITNNLILLNV